MELVDDPVRTWQVKGQVWTPQWNWRDVLGE